MWEVLMNGRSLGIIETDLAWASRHWRAKNRAGVIFALRPRGGV